MAIRTGIQARVTLLMVIFSVILIVCFTSLELKSKMNSITMFNAFKARLGAFAARNALIPNVDKIKSLTAEEADDFINKILLPFKESELIEKIKIINKDESMNSEDRLQIMKVEMLIEQNKWLFYFVNKKSKTLDMIISFMPDNKYIIKLSYSLGNIKQAMKETYYPIIITIAVIIIANIIFAAVLSKMIINPIKALYDYTKIIASGGLRTKIELNTDDELQELAESFNYMTHEIQKMKIKAENANPLTKLPGNIVILENIESRIRAKWKFTVLYGDLNNFKAYNDKYGIHKGDDAIKMTADVMKKAVRELGNLNDLVGHEGGDDFVIVTTPDKAENIAKAIIKNFDEKVKELYDSKDIKEGYFISRNRQDEIQRFPIMGISIAGVTNSHREIQSYGEVTNICAEVKKKVKSMGSSSYWIDVRREKQNEHS